MSLIQTIPNNKGRNFRLFLGLILIAVVLIFMIFGIYPVAIVNGRIITAAEFHRDVTVASLYYANLLKAYNQGKEGQKTINQPDLESGVLTGLIEDRLVEEKLSADLGDQLAYMVNEKLNTVGDSQNLKNAAATLYGMGWNDFMQKILVPQAKRDILSENLFLKKESVDNWLAGAKQSASVMIFSSKFSWDGSAVVPRK